jgi:hypothetical protein
VKSRALQAKANALRAQSSAFSLKRKGLQNKAKFTNKTGEKICSLGHFFVLLHVQTEMPHENKKTRHR